MQIDRSNDHAPDVGTAPSDEPQGEVTLDPGAGEDLQSVLRELEAASRSGAGEPPPSSAEPAPSAQPAEEDWREKYLRALADFENQRKRHQRQISDLRRYGAEPAIREMLPVLDNLERALDAALKVGGDALAAHIDGLQRILAMFQAAITRLGVTEVPAMGQSFDPNDHEAVQEVITEEHPENTVVHVMEKGFRLHDRLLRPAKVIVARRPS